MKKTRSRSLPSPDGYFIYAKARLFTAFLSLTFQRAMCKLLMSKRADKGEGERDRSLVLNFPLLLPQSEKAHIIIFLSRRERSSDCVCQRKMSSSVPTFFVFSLCLLALAVAGEFLGKRRRGPLTGMWPLSSPVL